MANTNTVKEETTDDDNLKEEGCSTTDTNSHAKKMIQNDDDSIQSQPHEITFPQQLMDLIEMETNDDNAANVNGQKAIEWLSTGDRFIIRDKSTVESFVLTKYFNNKCKFMSFVRKLYRWGFRQVEKDHSSGTMIFMHKHFTRGDKKKCLAMRSTVNVKKPSAASIVGLHASSNRWLGYRDVGAVPNAGDGMAERLLQSNRQADYDGDATMLSNVGYGGATYNMLGGRANPGLSMNYPGMQTQMMQMQMPQYNNLHNRLDWIMPGQANNRSVVAQRSSGAAAAVPHANQGYSAAVTVSQPSAGISNIGGMPGDVMAERLLQSNRQAGYGGDATMLSNVGYGGATYNMLGGRANPGLSMNYPGMQTQMMQMQMPQYNNLHNRLDWTMPGQANNRSVVAQRSSGAAAAVPHANQGYSAAVTVSQPSAGISNIGGMPGDVMAERLLQSNRQAGYGGDATMLSNVGYGGATYNMLGGRANPGLSMNYPGMQTQMMQMQMPQYNNLHNGLDWIMPGQANNRSVVAQRSSGAAAAVPHANQGYSAAVTVSQPTAGISNIGGLPPDCAGEVNLALSIMNEDPTIDAWQALQLAKMFLDGNSSTSYQRRPN